MQVHVALVAGGVRSFNTDPDAEGKHIKEAERTDHGMRFTFPGGNTLLYPWTAVLYVQHTFAS